MGPKIKIQSEEPPPFWDRRVLFFSNLHSIFYGNFEATQQLMNEITGAHTYGGRVLSILDLLFRRRPNLMLLEVEPEFSLMEYLLREVGLSLPQHEILEQPTYDHWASEHHGMEALEKNLLFKTLREHPAEWIDGSVTDTRLVEIAARLGKRTISTLEGSKNGNNKYLLYQYQREQSLPTFETFAAANTEELQSGLNCLRKIGYRTAVVKAQIGASGYGMLVLPAEDSATTKVPEHLFFEGPCMVQGWIEDGILGMRKLASPSVQLFLNEDTVFLYDRTEQILSEESVHQGNMSPPPVAQQFPEVAKELWRQAALAGTWLHGQGYRGTGSVDFLIVERAGSLETIICEVNARVTGATYPALLARHFNPRGAWLMINIRFRQALAGKDLFSQMNRVNALFRPGRKEGMIPFNFNTDVDGKVFKGQFVCTGGTLEDCNGLLERAWAQLPVEWGYDRD